MFRYGSNPSTSRTTYFSVQGYVGTEALSTFPNQETAKQLLVYRHRNLRNIPPAADICRINHTRQRIVQPRSPIEQPIFVQSPGTELQHPPNRREPSPSHRVIHSQK